MRKIIAAALGTSLLSCLFASPAIAEKVTMEIDGNNLGKQNIAEFQGVQAILTYEDRIDADGDINQVPVLVVSGGGAKIETTGPYFSFPSSQVQIAELDQSNSFPEVIFSNFTGGAHCCSEVKFLTFHPESSQWKVVDVGYFDGGVDGVEDFDENGVYELITWDNRFLYKYSSYAGSYPPVQVLGLAGLQVKDMSKEPQFSSLHRIEIQRMWRSIELATNGDSREMNGVLAGYMATKAILGEADSAWAIVKNRYDRSSNSGLQECSSTNYNYQSNCAGQQINYDSFPAALWAFLIRTNYLSEDTILPD